MLFFILDRPPRGSELEKEAGTEAFKIDPVNRGPAPRCPLCGNIVGPLTWLSPFNVELETKGRRFGDLAYFAAGDDILVSEFFSQAYATSDLTGLSGFEPVEVTRVKRHRQFSGVPPAYFKGKVSLGKTAVDLAASVFEWDAPPSCDVCRLGTTLKRWKRVIIDLSTWSGEDVFIARGLPGSFIVSERFKVSCEQNDVSNVYFVPVESFNQDFYPWDRKGDATGSVENLNA
jgi:hypothetical protein